MFQVFTRSFPQLKLFPADDGLYALACEAARAPPRDRQALC